MPESKQPLVVGIGEVLWDVFPTGKKAGGAPINFVYHATQMGAKGYAVSAVGDDDLGKEILKELKDNNINYIIETVPYPTGTVLVTLNDGIPSYEIVQNTAWDNIPLSQAAIDITKQADAICYGTLALRSENTRKTVNTLLSYAPKNAIRFFDINLRQNYYSKELIDSLLKQANVFKINDDEIKVIKEMYKLNGTDDDVCRYFIDAFNLRFLIFTAGEKYSIVYSPGEKSRIETPKVTVVDTVGAGDAFSGAFIYKILTGSTLRQAHEEAVKTAAFVCTKAGAWPAYH